MARSIIRFQKKTFLFGFLVFFFISLDTFAQKVSQTYYATLAEGVKLYKSPSKLENPLATIIYGAKVTSGNSDADKLEIVDNPILENGIRTYWIKVSYNNIQGYVIRDNFSPVKPPAENTDKLSDWAKQVSKPTTKWETGKIAESLSESENNNYFSRQLFENGMLLTITSGYDVNSSETLQIPYTNVFAIYNLIRNIGSFKSIFRLNTLLQNGTTRFKDAEGNEYKWNVSYQAEGENEESVLKSVEITWNNGVNNTLKISSLGDDTIIFYENTL